MDEQPELTPLLPPAGDPLPQVPDAIYRVFAIPPELLYGNRASNKDALLLALINHWTRLYFMNSALPAPKGDEDDASHSADEVR